jgi:hypothetical protein
MLFPPKTTPNAKRVHVGVTRKDGTREHLHLVNDGNGELVEQSRPASPPAEQPAFVMQPVRASDLAELIIAAGRAAKAIDRFVQLHDPAGKDLAALERLNRALVPFLTPAS